MIGHPGVVTRGVKPIDRVKERVQVGSVGARPMLSSRPSLNRPGRSVPNVRFYDFIHVIDGKGQRLLNFGESLEQLKARHPGWKAVKEDRLCDDIPEPSARCSSPERNGSPRHPLVV